NFKLITLFYACTRLSLHSLPSLSGLQPLDRRSDASPYMKPALYPSQVLQPGRAHSLLRQSPILDDKYDHPSLRASIISNFRTAAVDLLAGNTTFLMKNIPDHRGPDALRPPDKLLRGEALDFCAPNYDQIFMHSEFGNA
ncbi:hypothetical protein D6D20_04808, partial [Aureobasidium pullulans]